MTNPLSKAGKRETFASVADAIASLDLDQEVRETVADAVVSALAESPVGHGVNRDVYVLLASDPLVPCAGWDADGEHHDCPDGTVIRQPFHNRDAPDGRSAIWESRAPFGEIRCVRCGAMHFNPEYRQAVLAREER